MSRPRRLVKLGSSLFVSLPRAWARSRELDKGSEVLVMEDEASGGLLLLPEVPSPKSRSTIGGRATSSKLLAAYLDGCREIEVTLEGLKAEDVKLLNDLASSLVGVERTYEDSTRIIYSCFVDDDQDPDDIIGRMIDTLSGMIVDAAVALDCSDKEGLEKAAARDETVNKLYFLLVRILRSSSKLPKTRLMDFRLLAKILERIGDEISLLARKAPPRWRRTSLTAPSTEISRMLGESYGLFLDERLEEAEDLGSRAWSLSCEFYGKAIKFRGFRSQAYMAYSAISGLIKDIADLTV